MTIIINFTFGVWFDSRALTGGGSVADAAGGFIFFF